MKEHVGEIPLLIMNRKELSATVDAMLRERFGGYDASDPLHTSTRRKLLASVFDVPDSDGMLVAVHGEEAHLMRRWLNTHAR